MKPKTKLQKEVAELMPSVKPLNPAQERYAYRHCFEHAAFLRKATGEAICSECGNGFKMEKFGRGKIRCPHCGTVIDPNTKHRKTLREKSYYLVTDTAGRFQLLRWFLCETVQRAGQPAWYDNYEVSQIWIAPDGSKVRVEQPQSAIP